MRIEPGTDSLKHALDVAELRHGLLAQNLANLNTSTYTRTDVDFEAALKDGSNDGSGHIVHQGSPDLVSETGDMAATDAFYMACSRLLSLKYQELRQALK